MKYIYLLKAGDTNFKIGVATNVIKRVRQIQTGCPDPVEIVCCRLVENAERAERDLHASVGAFKTGGGTEWFRLLPEQALAIAVDINKLPEVRMLDYELLIGEATRQHSRDFMELKVVLDGIKSLMRQPTPEQDEAEPNALPRDIDMEEMAMEVFREAGKASTSLLQRRLSIGYGRASRLMDSLEAKGMISPQDGAKPRLVLS